MCSAARSRARHLMRDLTASLEGWLAGGGCEIGEVSIAATAEGGFELCHCADRERADLPIATGIEAARAIASFDEAGKFRPLKTAPNLRRGWKLRVGSVAELRRALDAFYPAMLGVWVSHTNGALTPVPLRETLGRQSGMYRVTQKLADEQAQTLVGCFCQSETGCLKHLLWPLSSELPIATLPPEKLAPPPAERSLPLLCHEACNLLVAEARTVVKKYGPSA
jgi:sirohydrochlorin cobaltochelatase